MRLLEHSKGDTGYRIRIWLDETKHDLQGNPYEEWVWTGSWGLEVPMNKVEDVDGKGKPKLDENGKPLYKQVPAMTQEKYEKSQLEEAKRQASELLASLTNNSQQVTKPQEL